MKYDLEDRTLKFSKNLLSVCRKLKKDVINKNLINQVVRSGTSVGANYREANETDTKKDFKYRIRIAKKEAKETQYWLELLVDNNFSSDISLELERLLKECIELKKILGAIYEKSK